MSVLGIYISGAAACRRVRVCMCVCVCVCCPIESAVHTHQAKDQDHVVGKLWNFFSSLRKSADVPAAPVAPSLLSSAWEIFPPTPSLVATPADACTGEEEDEGGNSNVRPSWLASHNDDKLTAKKTHAKAPRGVVALAERGSCTFVDKASCSMKR